MYDLLKGVRVLDLTTVVLGPFATRYLADFGADVIKVETPQGDIFRYVKPSRSETMGAGYLNMNRNKRCLCLDLKQPGDRRRFEHLLDDADVLVHNMRASAASRLGVDPHTLRESHPRLVYCSAPGYASTGPNADKPAYDDIIQAASGIAALNKGENGEPRYLPTIVCDKVGGLHLAMAVLAGIAHQQKTGMGCVIEAPMFEGMVSFLMAEQLAGETFHPAQSSYGYERLLTPFRRPHRTRDGYIGVLPYNSAHWTKILEFLGSDLAIADWVKSSSARSDRIGELYEVLAMAMPDRTTREWLEIFTELDIPCSTINDLDEVFLDEHLAGVNMLSETDHPTEGRLNSVRMPFWVEGVEQLPDAPAPNLDNAKDSIQWKPR